MAKAVRSSSSQNVGNKYLLYSALLYYSDKGYYWMHRWKQQKTTVSMVRDYARETRWRDRSFFEVSRSCTRTICYGYCSGDDNFSMNNCFAKLSKPLKTTAKQKPSVLHALRNEIAERCTTTQTTIVTLSTIAIGRRAVSLRWQKLRFAKIWKQVSAHEFDLLYMLSSNSTIHYKGT